MHWFLVHTKPRQEARALENLQRQGFKCFLPTWIKHKSSHQGTKVSREPLFSRYLFIQLDTALSGKSWAPIRSTVGVSRLVSFGPQPARVDSQLITLLQQNQDNPAPAQPPFQAGDLVRITKGPFEGLDAIYQTHDGEQRAMILIEILHRPTRLGVAVCDIEPN